MIQTSEMSDRRNTDGYLSNLRFVLALNEPLQNNYGGVTLRSFPSSSQAKIIPISVVHNPSNNSPRISYTLITDHLAKFCTTSFFKDP